jgi:RNA polymerase sigma factor (sigma-70 family)
MSYSPAKTVLHFLRRQIAVRDADSTSDGQLVRRFAQTRDEAAFAELLRRHGPMVLGVCRRVLGNSADADDAFQATFLVLVHKAGALGAPESVANWLHGVAHRTALKARVEAAKRLQREREAGPMPTTSATDDVIWRDLRPVLDEEIQRLPARYRAPFLLCHLEGMTNEEAARQLGCPEGTILSRLSRARDRLRVRLAKRGITISATALAAVVTGKTAAACVPAALAQTTLQAAMTLATAGIVAAHVLTLTEGVIHAMFAAKVKFAATVLLGVTLIAGAGSYGYGKLSANGQTASDSAQAGAGKSSSQPPGAVKDRSPEATQKEVERKRIQISQRDAYREQWNARRKELLQGKTTVDMAAEANRFWGAAEIALSDNKTERVAAIQAQIDRAQTVERIVRERFDAGLAKPIELTLAKADRENAEGLLSDEQKSRDDFEERRAAIELNRKLQPLMQKRLDAVREQMRARAEEFLAAKTTLDVVLECSANLLKAQQEMSDRPVDRLRMLEMHYQRMKTVHEIMDIRFRAGKATTAETAQAAYNRYDAEIALERFKAKLGNDKPKGEVTKALFEGTDLEKILSDVQRP